MSETPRSLKLTKRAIDAAQPKATRYELWDSEVKGFGLRIEPSGAKSFIFRYRPSGGRKAQKRFKRLGAFGELTPDQARRDAEKLRGQVARGEDPVQASRDKDASLTVAEMARAFIAEHVKTKRKPNTAALYEYAVEGHLIPKLGTKRAASLAKTDVAKMHHELGDRPYLANRVLAVVGSLYTWAGKRGLLEEGFNPAARIEKFREDRRERFLSVDELERLGAAIREAETVGVSWEPDPEKKVKHAPKAENRRSVISSHAAAAIRLLLFTGARLREILHLRWEHVDLDRGLLLLPDSKTGRKTIVLNTPALVILNDLVRVGSYVIAGESAGTKNEKPRSDLKRPWSLVAKRAGLTGVRIHDLRHSFASVGAGGGLGLPMIGKLLGHTQPQTTARYAHLDADPLRRASDAIASTIAAALEGRHATPATPMRRRAE